VSDESQDELIIENPIDETQFYRGDKKIPKEDAQFTWTPKMVKEIKKCQKDIIYFAENYFYITNLDRGKEKIKLYVKQKQILRSLMSNRFVVVCSCRQAGKTTLMTIYALWVTCFTDDQRAVIVANKEQTAINVFKRIRTAYEQLPNFLKPGVKEYGKTGLTLANDSSIGISTTTSTAVRGESINCLIVDEMAFIESHLIDEFWKSVIPVISSGKKTKIFVTSTPNGTNNKFYEVYSEGEKEKNSWKAERIDWYDVPGRTERWKKQMIDALGSEEAFMQEFGNTFLDAGNSAVGATVIERFKTEKKPPLWHSEDNTYRVYEYPDKNKIYAIGVDVGEGIGRAASVAQVFDITDLTCIEQVAVYGTNLVEPYHFANCLFNLANQWGQPPLLVERNNCGAQVIDALCYKHSYEKIVSCSKVGNLGVQHNTNRHLGVLSHNNLRFAGVANMRYWINFLQTVRVNDVDTIGELETFIRYPNGTYRKRNDNFYDDRVMSMVWALFILEPEICQQWFQIEEYDTQNKPLKITQLEYFDTLDNSFYTIKDLNNNIPVISQNNETQTPSYTPIITEDEYEKYFNNSDIYDLQQQGWKML
jgi:hypothetical protein